MNSMKKKKKVNEMKTVYFAHSVKDYNEQFEDKCIEEILINFPNAVIVNPKNDA